MDEIWKDIKGFEGFYQVSNLGKVKSLDRIIEQRDGKGEIYFRKIKGKILSLKKNNGNGYSVVNLTKGYKTKKYNNFYIHRLVATAFISNPDNKPEVNHIDGNKENNNISNLEWITEKENMKHAFENELNIWVCFKDYTILKGSNNPTSKLNEEKVKEIISLFKENKYSDRQIANMYNLKSAETIRQIRIGKSWKHVIL